MTTQDNWQGQRCWTTPRSRSRSLGCRLLCLGQLLSFRVLRLRFGRNFRMIPDRSMRLRHVKSPLKSTVGNPSNYAWIWFPRSCLISSGCRSVKATSILFLLFACIPMLSHAQEQYHGKVERYDDTKVERPITRPRPYFFGGPELDGNGAAVLNYQVGAGIQEEAKHYSLDTFAQYINTRKIDDNTINNHNGRTRELYGAARYRLPHGWLLGGGARWSELSTTNYVKQHWSPFVGGGKDWPEEVGIRIDYLWNASEHVNRQGCPVPNGQCTNGEKGFDFQYFVPSLSSNSHVVFKIDLLPILFHTTVTSTDPALTRQQENQRSIASWLDFTLLFRY